MKKKFVLITITGFLILFGCVGCRKTSNKKVIESIDKKISELASYNLKGNLEIANGEDMYTYNVEVSYKKDELFKVSLINTNNNHVQVLLKNTDGVYVLTPSLNKSFKFQSDWPYNNSQIYLYQTIINDIKNDSSYTVEKNKSGYIITSKVNYSNNENLISQKVYVDKDYIIAKVEVLNNENTIMMTMTFNSSDLNPTFEDDYFTLNACLNASITTESTKEVSVVDNIIYPLYLPANTYLKGQDIVDNSVDDRVIMTFDGDNSFMLIQETSKKNDELITIPVDGEPMNISDTLGIVSKKSVSWESNGIEYYVTSDTLSESELINIANSVNVLPVGK